MPGERAAVTQSPIGTPFAGHSLVEMLRFRAACQPNDRAYTFLRDGEDEGGTITYAELDRKSRIIAAVLQDRLAPGDRALLLYQPGLEFIPAFFGCLYAGVIAVPACPPHAPGDRSSARVSTMLKDAEPSIALTTHHVLDRGGTTGALDSSRLVAMATDRLPDRAPGDWSSPTVDEDALALLQYTSGSTASPKGVMVSHANLLHNLSVAFHAGSNDQSTVFISWLPVLHDMGLIEGVLQPLFSGCPAYLMSPVAFLQRPVRWLKAISRYRATRSGAPNFAYDLVARTTTSNDRARLRLDSWTAAYCGSEPIRADTLRTFVSTFHEAGFRESSLRPCYGLAESTLVVSTGRWSSQSTGDNGSISCGSPAPGTRVAIVDPDSHIRMPEECLGEIWIDSPSVAHGYWRQREVSGQVFRAQTADGDGPFLRTGDLGFTRRGELHITGRIKDVLIVRGHKHHPQDLERTASRQSPLFAPEQAAAVTLESTASGDRIALLLEADARHFASADAANALIAAIRQAVAAEHGIQLEAVALVPARTLHRTTSGKLQRFACRDAYRAGRLPTLAAWERSRHA